MTSCAVCMRSSGFFPDKCGSAGPSAAGMAERNAAGGVGSRSRIAAHQSRLARAAESPGCPWPFSYSNTPREKMSARRRPPSFHCSGAV